MSYQRQFPGNHIKCIAFIDPTNPALSINMRGVPPKKKNSEKGTLYHIPFTSYPVLEDGSSRRRVGIVIRPFFCFSFFFGAKNNGFKRLRFSGKQKAALNQSQPATCQQSRGLGIGDRGSGIGDRDGVCGWKWKRQWRWRSGVSSGATANSRVQAKMST